MIISASTDYREAARRKLPPFLFHYIDGGAYAEQTLRRNVDDFAAVALRQTDEAGREKFSPLADWLHADVWHRIRERQLPQILVFCGTKIGANRLTQYLVRRHQLKGPRGLSSQPRRQSRAVC